MIKKLAILFFKILFCIGIVSLFINIYINVFYFNIFSSGKHYIKFPINKKEAVFYESIKSKSFPKIIYARRSIYKTKDWCNTLKITYGIQYSLNFMADSLNKKSFDTIAYNTLSYVRNDEQLKKYKLKNIIISFNGNHLEKGLEYNFKYTDSLKNK